MTQDVWEQLMAYGGVSALRMASGGSATMAMESNEQRFRSFCERYVIARTPTFRVGHEEEDQWTCMLNAKSAYRKIEAMGRGITKEDEAMALKSMEAASQPIGQQLRVRVPPASLSPWDKMVKRTIADSKSWTGYGKRRGK